MLGCKALVHEFLDRFHEGFSEDSGRFVLLGCRISYSKGSDEGSTKGSMFKDSAKRVQIFSTAANTGS